MIIFVPVSFFFFSVKINNQLLVCKNTEIVAEIIAVLLAVKMHEISLLCRINEINVLH